MTNYPLLAAIVARRTPGEWQWVGTDCDYTALRILDGAVVLTAEEDCASETDRTFYLCIRQQDAAAIVTAVNHFAGAVERIAELDAEANDLGGEIAGLLATVDELRAGIREALEIGLGTPKSRRLLESLGGTNG